MTPAAKAGAGGPQHKLELRRTRAEDYADVREIMRLVYPDMGPWSRKVFLQQLHVFPEGQLCIVDEGSAGGGKVIAAVVSVIVDYDDFGDRHTYDRITGEGTLSTHNPEGDTLYGVDIFVHPDFQGLRLGRRLYDARKALCESLNLRRIILGGRIPGYADHADAMTPQRYIELVRRKELHDPVLGFQLANDFHVRRVRRNYSPYDASSHGYAVLLEWINIYYEENERLIGGRPEEVRVGVVQWQMRNVKAVDDVLQQAEFFVDAVAGYNADFVVFPEFFNAPLMALEEHETPADAIRALAAFTPEIRDRLQEMALSYNVNIIAGSMPEYTRRKLYNVSYLLRRDGTQAAQYKLHVTPDERAYWGIQGGSRLDIFETDAGRVGILICYDVEFPELSRILAERDMDILFVPFLTDTQEGYLRVRHCAQARAVENECYVVISGSVGNLPRVENMDIQYAQSAVFTPSDFAFARDAVAAETTANTEMTLIVDLDLDNLTRLRTQGSVRNRQDRRRDLYRVEWLGAAAEEKA